MRVAIVTESFLPSINGVTTSVCRVAECLHADGHEVVVIAPEPAPAWFGAIPVHTVRSVPVRRFPTGLPGGRVAALLAEIRPDVVHVASPFVLGARALVAARDLGIPRVAIYQTDMPRYIEQHGGGVFGPGAARAAWRWVRWMHEQADLTLAPSRPTLAELEHHGVPRLGLWGRGVDGRLFTPARRHDVETAEIRNAITPAGEVVVGYVGRIAAEKELHRLAVLVAIPRTRLVIVGDGPGRAELAARLRAAPGADIRPPVFLGFREGLDLARAYAAFDVFVHPGTTETFGQTLQEAASAGLPVVAAAAGGALDLVDHGVTGYLADPAQPSAWSACVGHLVAEPGLRARMGAAGAAAVAGRSWAGRTRELISFYEVARERSASLTPA